MIKYSKELLKKFGKTVSQRIDDWRKKQVVIYNIEPNLPTNLQVWFSKNYNTEQLQTLSNELIKKYYFTNDDDYMISLLKWTWQNVEYVGDLKKWKVHEKWQRPNITLETKSGDCEDGALLIMSLARLAGIPSSRIRLVCGMVEGGGHAWISYTSETNTEEYYLDWCYCVDLNKISVRTKAQNLPNYKSFWFAFNDVAGFVWGEYKKPFKEK